MCVCMCVHAEMNRVMEEEDRKEEEEQGGGKQLI